PLGTGRIWGATRDTPARTRAAGSARARLAHPTPAPARTAALTTSATFLGSVGKGALRGAGPPDYDAGAPKSSDSRPSALARARPDAHWNGLMPPGSNGPTEPAAVAAADLSTMPKRVRTSSTGWSASANQSTWRKSTDPPSAPMSWARAPR